MPGGSFRTSSSRSDGSRGTRSVDRTLHPACRRQGVAGAAPGSSQVTRASPHGVAIVESGPGREPVRRTHRLSGAGYSDRDAPQSRTAPTPRVVRARCAKPPERRTPVCRERAGGPRRGLPERSGASLRALLREGVPRSRPQPRPHPASRRHGTARSGQPVAMRHRRRLGPRPNVELPQDPRDMDAGRLLGHVERRADLAVGRAARDEREHLPLARGEPERVLRVLRAGRLRRAPRRRRA